MAKYFLLLILVIAACEAQPRTEWRRSSHNWIGWRRLEMHDWATWCTPNQLQEMRNIAQIIGDSEELENLHDQWAYCERAVGGIGSLLSEEEQARRLEQDRQRRERDRQKLCSMISNHPEFYRRLRGCL